MKKQKINLYVPSWKNVFPVFFLLVFLSACPKSNTSTDAFNGSWQMISFTVFAPEQPVIGEGDITWTFNSSDQSLLIENKLDDKYPYIKKSGSYKYSISGESKINIDGQTFDFGFDSGKLTLSDKPELDGPVIIFKK